MNTKMMDAPPRVGAMNTGDSLSAGSRHHDSAAGPAGNSYARPSGAGGEAHSRPGVTSPIRRRALGGMLDPLVEVTPAEARTLAMPARIDYLSALGCMMLRMWGCESAWVVMTRGLRMPGCQDIAFLTDDRVLWLDDDDRTTIHTMPRSEPLPQAATSFQERNDR